MGRSPSCDDNGLKKGPWTLEEDQILVDFINKHGHGSWRTLPKRAGLNRCGKSCRLRWNNYLRPDIKRGNFTDEEERIIINLHSVMGNKWSKIAGHLPGRTDNEIKNYWNTHLRKKLLCMGIDPRTHKSIADLSCLVNLSRLMSASSLGNAWENALRLQADATQLAKIQLLHNIFQAVNTNLIPNVQETNLFASQNLVPSQNGIMDLFQAQTMFPNAGLVPEVEAQYGNYPTFSSLQASFNGGILSPDLSIKCDPTDPGELFLQQAPVMEQSHTMDQTKCKNLTCGLNNSSLDSNIVEEWEKLLEDESCSSFWKDIME